MNFIVAVCKDAELLLSINRRGDQEDSPRCCWLEESAAHTQLEPAPASLCCPWRAFLVAKFAMRLHPACMFIHVIYEDLVGDRC